MQHAKSYRVKCENACVPKGRKADTHSAMVEPNRTEIRAWIHSVLKRMGETPTGLARRAGVAQSTLTRFLNNDEAPMLGLRTMAKIAHVAGVQPLGMPDNAVTHRPNLDENDGIPYAVDYVSPFNSAITALIGDRVATDPWMIKTRSLEDAGIMPDDIVIVSLNEPPKPGSVICAQSYRWSEGRAETIFRIYEPPYIVAATRDTTLRRPMLVDNDRVIIKGVVIAQLRWLAD